MIDKKVKNNEQKSDSKAALCNTLCHYWKDHENSKIYIPILLLLLTYGAFFVLFKSLVHIDTQLFLEIFKMRTPALDTFFVLWTNGGSFFFIFLVVLVLWLKGERSPAIYLAAGLIADLVFVTCSQDYDPPAQTLRESIHNSPGARRYLRQLAFRACVQGLFICNDINKILSQIYGYLLPSGHFNWLLKSVSRSPLSA